MAATRGTAAKKSKGEEELWRRRGTVFCFQGNGENNVRESENKPKIK
jgi:hypothetical protein